jgi:hypothetical protein
LLLFTAASSHIGYVLLASLYGSLLNSHAHHQNIKEAIHIFSLEYHGLPKPTASVYAYLLDVYMLVNDVNGALMLSEFHNIGIQGKIPWDKV